MFSFWKIEDLQKINIFLNKFIKDFPENCWFSTMKKICATFVAKSTKGNHFIFLSEIAQVLFDGRTSTKRGFQNRAGVKKSVPHLFKRLLFLIYWEYARCEHTKMELEFHFFGKLKTFWKNQFSNIFSLIERLRNRFSRFRGPPRNFRKNREKSQIGPGRSGKLWKPSQTNFLEFRRSLRSKRVIYQPHTTIFEEIVFLWSSGIFRWFPGNRILVDLRICDIAEGKHNILGK